MYKTRMIKYNRSIANQSQDFFTTDYFIRLIENSLLKIFFKLKKNISKIRAD
jgi:hypothetical protein